MSSLPIRSLDAHAFLGADFGNPAHPPLAAEGRLCCVPLSHSPPRFLPRRHPPLAAPPSPDPKSLSRLGRRTGEGPRVGAANSAARCSSSARTPRHDLSTMGRLARAALARRREQRPGPRDPGAVPRAAPAGGRHRDAGPARHASWPTPRAGTSTNCPGGPGSAPRSAASGPCSGGRSPRGPAPTRRPASCSSSS